MPCEVDKQINESNKDHGFIIKLVIIGFTLTWLLMFGFSRCHAEECVSEQELRNAICAGCNCLDQDNPILCMKNATIELDNIIERIDKYGFCREE